MPKSIEDVIAEGPEQPARDALKRHLAQQPEDAQAWYLLSMLTNDPTARRRALVRALALEPQHAEALAAFNALNSPQLRRRGIPPLAIIVALLVLAGLIVSIAVLLSGGDDDVQPDHSAASDSTQTSPQAPPVVEAIPPGVIVDELGEYVIAQSTTVGDAGANTPSGALDMAALPTSPPVDRANLPPVLPVAGQARDPLPPPVITPEQPPTIVQLPTTGAATDQIVVRFDPNASAEARDAYLASIGATVTEEIASIHAVVVSLGPDSANQLLLSDPPAGAPILAQEPDYVITAQIDAQIVSDPRYAEQWALPVIAAPEAWAALDAGAPVVRVALIDSGICANADLNGRYAGGWDFVDDDADPTDTFGHGCAVAGILAANMNDGLGIAGIAPNVQIMPFRVLDGRGIGLYSDTAAAIIQAVDSGADIINISMGGQFGSGMLADAVQYAAERDVMIVAAVGNTGVAGVMFPAAYPDVIGVGSINRDMTRSLFSSTGPQVDLMAPGADILAPDLSGGYRLYTGTSFAVPHVTGVAALEIALGQQLAQTGGIVRTFGASPLGPGETDYPVPGEDFEPVTGGNIPEGYMMIEGDIIAPLNYYEMNALGTYNPGSIWPDGIVPYTFHANMTSYMRNQAQAAMQAWEDAAGLTFVPRSNQYSYIEFMDDNGNSSYVGMIGGKQNVWIYNWSYTFIIAHEIGHALGLWHEHTRQDRDNYVTINWANIIDLYEYNFSIASSSYGRDHSTYDFESIMHYSPYAFYVNSNQYTIIAKPAYASYQNLMGNRGHLSDGDKAVMSYLYPNPTPQSTATPTPTATFTPTATGIPAGFETIAVRDSELLNALQSIPDSDLEYFAVDYMDGEIIIYIRQAGSPGKVTIRFDWYPNITGLTLVNVTDVNGAAATAGYDQAVRAGLPHDLSAALDRIVAERFGGVDIDVDEILVGEDSLQIGVIP